MHPWHAPAHVRCGPQGDVLLAALMPALIEAFPPAQPLAGTAALCSCALLCLRDHIRPPVRTRAWQRFLTWAFISLQGDPQLPVWSSVCNGLPPAVRWELLEEENLR